MVSSECAIKVNSENIYSSLSLKLIIVYIPFFQFLKFEKFDLKTSKSQKFFFRGLQSGHSAAVFGGKVEKALIGKVDDLKVRFVIIHEWQMETTFHYPLQRLTCLRMMDAATVTTRVSVAGLIAKAHAN